MNGFRLASYNIAGHASEVSDTLYEINADIYCIQEAYDGTLNGIMFDTDCEHGIFGASTGHFGNCIVSKYEIKFSETVQYFHEDAVIPRSFTRCIINLPNGMDICIGVTHLNHKSESVRMSQLEFFRNIFLKCDMVVGDFNSTLRDEYTVEQYSRVPYTHIGDRVIKCIIDEMGFIDAHQAFRKEENVLFTMASTDLFMRIDYIFISKDFYRKITGGHLHCWSSNESDHLPVLFDFTFDKI